MSKKEGYVYYEADFFLNNLNPYLPFDAGEPGTQDLKKNFLKGIQQERIDAVHSGTMHLIEMLQGNEYNAEKVIKLYSLMCKDITRERNRVGGDWVIAHACCRLEYFVTFFEKN